MRHGLEAATFEQRRQLVLLLADRVVVTDAEVEIRHVMPTSPESEHVRFCHLRKDYFDDPSVPPEAGARVHAPARDAGTDAARAAFATAPGVVVAFVGVELGRAATRPAPPPVELYRRAYKATFLIQGWAQRDRRRSGVSAFQASQQASTMAS